MGILLYAWWNILRLAMGILLYAWWNIWKEWNRRIFQSAQQSEFLVACAAKEEIEQYRRAMQFFQPP
jgi:hypothetical protein